MKCTGPAYKGDDFYESIRQFGLRCDAAVTTRGLLGQEFCEACAERERKARRDPNSLGSILADAARKRGDQ